MTPNEKYIIDISNDVCKRIGKTAQICFIDNVKYQGACYKEEKLILYSLEKINAYPLEALRNLAIHEVCHLKHANHSKRFRNLCRKMGITEKYWLYGAPKKTPRPAYMKDL